MSTSTPTGPKSQYEVYSLFVNIADEVMSNTKDCDEADKIICARIDALYAQHEGTLAWDLAYERWYEPSDDDEEV